MRGINAEAQANPAFLVVFLGTGVLALGLGVAAVFDRDPLLIAGSVLAVVPVVVTVAVNVPLNNRLEAGLDWQSYRAPWTAWNHVRTLSGLLGGAVLVTAGTTG